ncbi:MAG: toll/interleukin-1 receptor domain-containing protein [Hyphomicrobiaceae bacterium]
MSRYFADCFVSYNNRDADEAKKLSEDLRAVGIRAFIYQHDLLPSNKIKPTIRAAVEDCDAFIPLISPHAAKAPWVARELALMRQLHKERRQPYPVVIPVYIKGQKPCRIRLRHFDTGLPLLSSYDLSAARGISTDNPHTDSVEQIATLLKPTVRHFGVNRGDIDEVPDELFDLYERLFPVNDERDDPHKIRHWINEAASLGSESPWLELFSTISIYGRPAGFAWLSAHPKSGYAFGNYFGMDVVWRKYQRAEYLLEELEKHALARCNNLKGILFEVEPYDHKVVARLLKRLRRHRGASPPRLNAVERETVRSLRRIALYLDHPKKQSKSFVGDDGRPLRYRQPAMEPPLSEKKEVDLFLMMRPLSKEAEQATYPTSELLDFMYDEVFGDAYEESRAVGLAGYRDYLKRLKGRVLSGNCKTVKLAYLLGEDERKLLHEVKKARILVPL